eukprot:scaffold15938_cov92-Isochrysis_galbana.AAC.2
MPGGPSSDGSRAEEPLHPIAKSQRRLVSLKKVDECTSRRNGNDRNSSAVGQLLLSRLSSSPERRGASLAAKSEPSKRWDHMTSAGISLGFGGVCLHVSSGATPKPYTCNHTPPVRSQSRHASMMHHLDLLEG